MSILIIGGGICGLGTALLLARDGHDVTLLERDVDPLPDSAQDAWDSWQRKGVAQFRQPHNFMPGLRLLLEAELPDVQEALPRAGASRFDLVNPLPPFFSDRSPRSLDEKLWTYTARRPVAEWVFASCAQHERRLTIRRGVHVTGLLTGPSARPGTPHVAGVEIAGEETLRADLVIDATGRHSRGPEWLAALGVQPPHETQMDCGFVYYTRYFSGTQPQRRAPGLMPSVSISLLTLPGDNGTWSVTVFTTTGDQPLKTLRHEEQWTNVVRACPPPRALARRPGDHQRSRNERHRRSLPPPRRRWIAGGDWIRRGRGRLGLHQPIGRTRAHRRLPACAAPSRHVARGERRSLCLRRSISRQNGSGRSRHGTSADRRRPCAICGDGGVAVGTPTTGTERPAGRDIRTFSRINGRRSRSFRAGLGTSGRSRQCRTSFAGLPSSKPSAAHERP